MTSIMPAGGRPVVPHRATLSRAACAVAAIAPLGADVELVLLRRPHSRVARALGQSRWRTAASAWMRSSLPTPGGRVQGTHTRHPTRPPPQFARDGRRSVQFLDRFLAVLARLRVVPWRGRRDAADRAPSTSRPTLVQSRAARGYAADSTAVGPRLPVEAWAWDRSEPSREPRAGVALDRGRACRCARWRARPRCRGARCRA
jgi:hypothetical protein